MLAGVSGAGSATTEYPFNNCHCIDIIDVRTGGLNQPTLSHPAQSQDNKQIVKRIPMTRSMLC